MHDTHTSTCTHQRYVGKRWDLSVVLKDEADWENLIFGGSVNSVPEGWSKEREFTIRFGIDRWNAQMEYDLRS